MENHSIGRNFLDIDRLLHSKNPQLAKRLPRFLVNYVKRIIHQDKLNEAIYTNRDEHGLDFVRAILAEFKANIVVSGLENIPEAGGAIVVANHPLGGLDGMALMQAIGEKRKDIKFPVNDLLMNLPNLRCLFVPINKHGSNTNNKTALEDAFRSDELLLYFPAGLVSRKHKGGEIKDLEWKKTFVAKARQYQRDVIPVFIDGKNSSFFYNLARWRKRLGLKANIEMLYLVDEMYKQRDQTIRVIIGKPVSYTVFEKTKRDKEWAERMHSHVYALRNNENKEFTN